jgi:hypothetical protein
VHVFRSNFVNSLCIEDSVSQHCHLHAWGKVKRASNSADTEQFSRLTVCEGPSLAATAVA